MKFICEMSTVQTYLGKWGKKRISTTPLPKFWEMMWRMWEREKEISTMILPKGKKKLNCGNWIAEIGGLKKRKKENWTVVRVMLRPQAILPYFYKLLLWPISYWFSLGLTNNITFLFTNNHSPHQQFMKVFIKKFVFLVFCQKWRIKKKKKPIVAIELPKLE